MKIEVNKIMKCEINNRKVDFFNKFHNENYNSKREDLEEEDQGEDERNVNFITFTQQEIPKMNADNK